MALLNPGVVRDTRCNRPLQPARHTDLSAFGNYDAVSLPRVVIDKHSIGRLQRKFEIHALAVVLPCDGRDLDTGGLCTYSHHNSTRRCALEILTWSPRFDAYFVSRQVQETSRAPTRTTDGEFEQDHH